MASGSRALTRVLWAQARDTAPHTRVEQCCHTPGHRSPLSQACNTSQSLSRKLLRVILDVRVALYLCPLSTRLPGPLPRGCVTSLLKPRVTPLLDLLAVIHLLHWLKPLDTIYGQTPMTEPLSLNSSNPGTGTQNLQLDKAATSTAKSLANI